MAPVTSRDYVTTRVWWMRIALLSVMIAIAVSITCSASSRADDGDDAKLKALQSQVEALTDKSDWAAAVPLALEAATLSNTIHGGDSVETAGHLYRLGQALRWLDKTDEAQRVLNAALAVQEKADPNSVAVADLLNELGWIGHKTMKLADSERNFERALSIWRKALGADALDNAWAADGLAQTYLLASRFVDAEAFAKEALRIKELHFPPGHKERVAATTWIAIAQHKLGKLTEAEQTLSNTLATQRADPNAAPSGIASTLGLVAMVNYDKGNFALAEQQTNEGLKLLEQIGAAETDTYFHYQSLLSKIYFATSRYAEAEAAAIKLRDAVGKVSGLNARALVDAYNSLSVIYSYQNRYEESEQTLKKSIALGEQVYGENSLDVSTMLENLAYLYADIDRPSDALGLFDRILRIRSAILPPDHAFMGTAKAFRAKVLNRLGRYGEAERDAREGQQAIERSYGPAHPLALGARFELAAALKNQDKFDDAIRLYQDAIQIVVAAEGAEANRLGVVYHDLGMALDAAGRLDEAEQAFHASIARKPQDGIPKAQTLQVLADLNVKQGKWSEALENYRRASAIFLPAFVSMSSSGSTRQYEGGNWLRSTARGQLKVLLEMGEGAPERGDAFAREGFALSQWLVRTSSTTAAISQSRARLATGNATLSEKARERQDVAERWSQIENAVSRSLALPIDQRNEQQQTLLTGELARLETRLSGLDKELADAFPAFAELSGSRAVPADELQTKWLGADEALISFAEVDGHVVVWVVTRDKVHWHTSPGLSVLNRFTWQMRCRLNDQFALDPDDRPFTTSDEWPGLKPGEDAAKACRRLHRSGFDVWEAHALYRFLLGPADELIKDKQLLIAASGAILNVPFNALVASQPRADQTGASDADQLRRADWLGTRNAITLIPSVSSLRALRLVVKAERASRPMIAFANPTLDGLPSATANEFKRRIAAYYQSCGLPPSPEEGLKGAADIFATSSLGLTSEIGAATDTAAAVRTLSPIPGTARLACELANRRQFLGSTVWLGASATEAHVRDLSNSGDLAAHRVVHFATHGLRGGQIAGMGEPGLILTPGAAAAGPDNDGYLSVSEITTLKLNADWVILSACDTAAGEKGGEALSGLARAFFYAGAQALLVTNWPVYEEAAIELVSAATQHMDDVRLGRADALRRAMKDLIEHGSDRKVNPSYWAPFMVVGEGAAPPSPTTTNGAQ